MTNHSAFDLYDVTIEVPADAGPGFWLHQEEPISRLPAGETASFLTAGSMGGGKSHFDITVHAKKEDDTEMAVPVFVNLRS